jgi:threonylcarbamoyladenosine tRNA methylthiotransferase MtaB
MKKFLTVNFGCRVNSAELNQLSQKYIDLGYIPDKNNPDLILINTCAITKKGEYESLSKIKNLQSKFPNAKIIATGCADLTKLKNIEIITKDNLPSTYDHQIKDKFSHTNRYLLRVQSGCTAMCSYCIVPYRRPKLWSIPINEAVNIVNQAVTDGYEEVIITGVNLNQYLSGLSNLLEALLTDTKIKLISFGSLPLLCIDQKFIKLLENNRVSHFLHIPLQSGSDNILKLMNRNYNVAKIKETFSLLRNVSFGTDIIVGFPGETESDFQDTINLCKELNFQKIHVFRFSPRSETLARELFLKSPKLSKEIIKQRSTLLRQLSSEAQQFDG